MSPFSVERRGANGEVSSYSLQRGEFLLSTEPEVWINVYGDEEASLVFPRGIERKGRREFKRPVILKKGVAVCDLRRKEEVIVEWKPSKLEKARKEERLRYRPISGRLRDLVAASGIHPERCRRGVIPKALEHGRCYSYQLALFTGASVARILVEPFYSFPLKIYDEATGRREKIEKLVEQEIEIKKAA